MEEEGRRNWEEEEDERVVESESEKPLLGTLVPSRGFALSSFMLLIV